MKPSFQTAFIQAVFGAITTLAVVCAFALKNPFVLNFIMVFGIGTGGTTVVLERHRRWAESGEKLKHDTEVLRDQLAGERDQFERWMHNERLAWETIKDKEMQRLQREFTQQVATVRTQIKQSAVALDREEARIKARETALEASLDDLNDREIALSEAQAAVVGLQAALEQEQQRLGREAARIGTLLESRTQEIWNVAHTEMATFREKALAEANAILSQVQTEQEKLALDREVFARMVADDLESLDGAKEDVRRLEKLHEDRMTQEYEQLDADAVAARQATISAAMQEWEKKAQQYNKLFDLMEGTILGLYQQIELLAGGKIEAPKEKGVAALVANKVLSVINGEFGLGCYYHDCIQYLEAGKDPAYAVWIRRGEGVKLESILALKKTIELECSAYGECRMYPLHGYVILTFGDCRKHIEGLPVEDASGKGSKKPVGRIEEPTWEKVKATVRGSRHVIILGPSGLGKTTAAKNFASLKMALLGGLDRCKQHIIDFKYPSDEKDGQPSWQFLGRPAVPQYYNLDNPESHRYVGLGLEDMAEFFIRRKTTLEKQAENHHAYSNFPHAFWFVDEVPSLVAMLKTVASGPIKLVCRVSRSLHGYLYLTGQTRKCSDMGFKTSDMDNFTRVYIGSAYAVAGLAELPIDPWRKGQLLADIYARQRLAEQQEAAGTVNEEGIPPASYFALLFTPSGQAFLMSLPRPGEYDNVDIEAAPQDSTAITDDTELVELSPDQVWGYIEEMLDEDERDSTAKRPRHESEPQEMTELERFIIAYTAQHIGKAFPYGRLPSLSKKIRYPLGESETPMRKEDIEAACRRLVSRNIGECDESGFRLTATPPGFAPPTKARTSKSTKRRTNG